MRQEIRNIFALILEHITIVKKKIISRYQEKKAKHIEMNIYDLFFQQNHVDGFNRLDIIVRYLAIENYFGKNDFGFELYSKMQEKRMGKEHALVSIGIFKELIDSWTKRGYDSTSEIECDCNLQLFDGSHRMALALYTKQNTIFCKVYGFVNDVVYGKEWFVENGFTIEEIKKILDKYEQICSNCVPQGTIACILWPTVEMYFEEITTKLGLLFKISDCNDIEFSDETFVRAVKGIYHIDDVEEWKIDKKIERMSKEEKKIIRLIRLNIDVPNYRLKAINNATISMTGEKIKTIIRNCYRNLVDDYFYDIIIHTGDNYTQSQYIYGLFEYPFSLNELFARLEDVNWMIIKFETSYMTNDFPVKFPFSKDIDIIVSKKEYERSVAIVFNYFLEKCQDKYEIKHIEGKGNSLIRIESKDYLILQIDISSSVQGIKDEFIQHSLKNRIKKDTYFLPIVRDEICFRIREVCYYPNKIQHIDYLKGHKQEIDSAYVKKNIEVLESELLKTLLLVNN